MRRGLTLLLAALALALAAGGLRLIRSEDQAAMPEQTAAPSDEAYEMMYERPLCQLSGIQVTLASGESYSVSTSMAFDKNGSLLGVYSTLGQPLTVDGREDFALDATAYQMMLLAAQGIPATAHYPGLDLDACGLASPKATLRIAYTDGSSMMLRIGSKTASGSSCYVTMTDSDEVYLVPYDFYDVMTRPLKDQHTLPGASAKSASDAVQIADDGTDEGRIIAAQQSEKSRVNKWALTSPVAHDASEDSVTQFVQGLCAVHAEGYVTTVYDVQGLADYGLDQPTRLVAVFGDGTLRDLSVGNDAGNGLVYVRMDQTGDIYTVGRSQLTFATFATLDRLMDRYVDLVPANKVQEVRIDTPAASWVMTQRWADESAGMPESCAIGSASLEQTELSEVYAALVGLSFDKTAPKNVENGAWLATITYCLRSGENREIKAYAYDDYYDVIATSGKARLLVRHKRVEALLKKLEDYPRETD